MAKANKQGKAIYAGKEFEILEVHVDGTIDIGIGKVIAVSQCPISEKEKEGHAMLIESKDVPVATTTKTAEIKATTK